jgi:hypothetical protein
VAAWIDEYDILRRHLAIGMISPAAFEASHDPGGMNAGSRLAQDRGGGFAGRRSSPSAPRRVRTRPSGLKAAAHR